MINMGIFKKKKIFFIYFSFQDQKHYTPLDVGYALALIKKKEITEYDLELYEYRYYNNFPENRNKSARELFDAKIKHILSKKPAAIFLFLDNVLWARTYALGAAKKIAQEIKKIHPDIYIGLQSYKFNEIELKKVFSCGLFNSAVTDNPEYSFLFLEDILKLKPVGGVIYDGSKEELTGLNHFSPANQIEEDMTLDFIPSPYLSSVLDKFLRGKQKEFGNNFTAFIYSSRGCRFGCYYCARSVKFEKVRLFSVRRFYDEVEYVYKHFGITHFMILDDAFLFSKIRLREFLAEFMKRKNKDDHLGNIRFFIMARIESFDEEVVEILKKINVVWIQIGLQTIKPDLQKYMNRAVSLEKFEKISGLLRERGINQYIDIILGLPNDSAEYFKKTLDFAVNLKPTAVQIKQFYFCPGTLFDQRREEFGIEIDNINSDVNLPCISRTKGIGRDYYMETDKYIKLTMKNHPEISWKVVTSERHFKATISFYSNERNK